MERARASVIIPTWNGCAVLARCLESVEAQELPGGFETIVVDDASTDRTAEVLRAYAGRIRVLRNTESVGYAVANNQGADAAVGDILFLLNADTELLAPDTLERLIHAIEQPGVGLVGPMLLNPDGSLQPSCAAHPSLLRAVVLGLGVHRALPQRLRLRLAPEFWSHDRPARPGWLLGAALAVRADVYRALGGMWSTSYGEEEDLAYRVQERGLRVHYESTARVMHIGNHSHGQKRSNVARAARVADAELTFLDRHYSRARAVAIRGVTGLAYAGRAVIHGLLRNEAEAQIYRAMARVYARRPRRI